MSGGPISEWERRQRQQRRHDLVIAITSWLIIALGAALIALGAWALIVLLIGVYG